MIYKDYSPVIRDVLVKYDDAIDEEAIKNSLRNIFTVQQNTLPGKPWFGNPLEMELFDLFTQTSESTILTAMQTAINTFEPRVEIKDIQVLPAEELNRIIVTLSYEIISTNVTEIQYLDIPFTHNNFTFQDGRTNITITPKP